MQRTVGEMRGTRPFKEVHKSASEYITGKLKIDLIHNDVPVYFFYKHKNNAWKSVLINNVFTTDSIPYDSEVYLSAYLAKNEKVVYSIEF